MEKKEKHLTVTVPAYNAEAYLEKNVCSMLGAAHYLGGKELSSLLEILIVDDGSTDGTPQLADTLCERFPGIIRVIHKENGGHGSGINTGIRSALGTYFKVIDADDWVDPEGFANLLMRLDETDADIVYSNFYWARETGTPETFRLKAELRAPFSGARYGVKYRFSEICEGLYIKMHSMTIRTELLRAQNRSIDEHCFYVDTEFVLFPIPLVRTILFLDRYVYMYRLGRSGQSMSPERMQRNEEQFERVLHRLLDFYTECEREVRSNAMEPEKLHYIANFLARVYAGWVKILLSYPASKEKKQKLQSRERELRRDYPEIYHSNGNRAVELLRRSGYLLYPLASGTLRLKNRIASIGRHG